MPGQSGGCDTTKKQREGAGRIGLGGLDRENGAERWTVRLRYGLFFQAIGQLRQRNIPGIQSLDDPGGASWVTLIAVRMQWRAATTLQYFSPEGTALPDAPAAAFVGTDAFEDAVGLETGNLLFHRLGSNAYPPSESHHRQSTVLG